MSKKTPKTVTAHVKEPASDKKSEVQILVENASKELENRGDYSKRDVAYIKGTWRQFLSYCALNNLDKYLPEYKDEFLSDLSDRAEPLKPATINRKAGNMKILDLYSRNGTWEKGSLDPKPDLNTEFMDFMSSQEEYLKKRHYSDISIETVRKQTYSALSFFQDKGIQKLSDLTADSISAFILSIKGHARSTFRCEISRVRQMLHNAYLLHYTESDHSIYVPTYNLGQPQSRVKIWKSEELDKVLEAVDRSNPKGLRDAAYISIATEYGMRSKDITDLKLEDFDWEACSISFTQSKTGKANTLPLSEKVGKAVIDYLRVRPKTDCEYLFVSMNPPYGKMKSFNSSFYRYVSRSGVSVPTDAHHGLHSLRATVATRLLNADVDPDNVVAMIGHSNRDSLHNYIRMDIEHLRACALSFEGGEFV